MKIRIHLEERVHTDIVAHSTDGFPTRTGQEFLEFLKATALQDQTLPTHILSRPSLARILPPSSPSRPRKPLPSSFTRESYFGVTEMHFTNPAEDTRFGRFQIHPEAGNDFLQEAAVAGKLPEYLSEEVSPPA